MQNLIEVRWHGRGGQGAKTAASLLAETALDLGKFVQAFPEYGPERAGAPMKAFTRIADGPITIHCGVTNPKVVVVIDPTLLNSVDVTEGLANNGILLVNTDQSPESIREKLKFKIGKVFTLDANKIAMETLKLPLPNMPMLGALVKATGLVNLEDVKENINKKFLKKIGEEKVRSNIEGIQRAYEEVKAG